MLQQIKLYGYRDGAMHHCIFILDNEAKGVLVKWGKKKKNKVFSAVIQVLFIRSSNCGDNNSIRGKQGVSPATNCPNFMMIDDHSDQINFDEIRGGNRKFSMGLYVKKDYAANLKYYIKFMKTKRFSLTGSKIRGPLSLLKFQ